MLNDPHLAKVFSGLRQEADRIFRASGIATSEVKLEKSLEGKDSDRGGAAVDSVSHANQANGERAGLEAARAAANKLIKISEHSRTSMFVDFSLRRPSEIRFLNGYVVRLGVKHNIPAPYNVAVTRMVEEVDEASVRGVEPPARREGEEIWAVCQAEVDKTLDEQLQGARDM
ncbi:hypothetical protein HDU93_006791, partial [Gonapodya sp. JEL0774]